MIAIQGLELSFSNLPVHAILIVEGRKLAFVLLAPIGFMVDVGVPTAYFDDDYIQIGDDQFYYGKAYSLNDYPLLAAWCKRQQATVVEPVIVRDINNKQEGM